MVALPPGQLDRAFLYNPTNSSEFSTSSYWGNMIREIWDQRHYANLTEDPMAVTKGRTKEAIKILGKEFGKKATQLRSGTFNPTKMRNEAQIYRKGPATGDAARRHLHAALAHNPKAKVTYVFPEFSAHYRSPEDITNFVKRTKNLGSIASGSSGVENILIPVGQYWHGHHPQGRLALQGYALTR